MVDEIPEFGSWLREPLVTTRLRLRPTVPGDEGPIIALFTDPDVRRHLGGPLSNDQARARIRITGERWGHFAITSRVDRQFLGTLSFARKAGPWELSFQLSRHAWGQGLAAEAISSAVEWFFTSTGETDLRAVTQVDNERCRRLLGRLGAELADRFEEHGAQQQAYRLSQPPDVETFPPPRSRSAI